MRAIPLCIVFAALLAAALFLRHSMTNAYAACLVIVIAGLLAERALQRKC